MKTDLDRLMEERGYDAVLVTGAAQHNPAMYYLANGAHVGPTTILVKKRGQAPVLLANPMEREEAALSGLRVLTHDRYHLGELLKEENGDALRAQGKWFGRIFAELELTGRVALFGRREQGEAIILWQAVGRANPQVRLMGEYGHGIFDQAASTKDALEVKRIRAVGKKTVNVVAGTAEFLQAQRAKGGWLVKKDGQRLTIGDVKHRIRELLLAENIEDPEGVIFAQGRDAGVPHSRGADRQPLALGKSIVYDIFPCEPGGGYFFDFTRTWCLGYAPPEVEQAHADVLEAFHTVRRALKPQAACRPYQQITCDVFETRGHATIRTDPETTHGYVHSLGHGVGLRLHEAPFFRDLEGASDRLEPGAVFTVEPGLYYPDHPGGGFGVRLEDTLWLNPKSLKFETLADYSKDLVLPVKNLRR